MAASVPIIDVDDDPKALKTDGQDQHKKGRKRKRASWASETLSGEQRDARIKGLEQEMEGLFGCYREMMDQRSGFGMGYDMASVDSGCALNSVVAVLMEESDLPLSKLVEAIHEKVKDIMGNVSSAAVKSAVLLVGQRVKYGLGNEEADVLEDDSHSSLWCWETRDAKWIPKTERVTIKARRTCRRKINERITAVSAMLTLLQKPENDDSYKHDFGKASEKLAKVLSEADIRLLMSNMLQKTGAEMAAKGANREEKLLIKQLERTKKEIEREKKKVDRELQKEKLQNEKVKKRLQDEAEKDEKRREREEAEMRKQLRKQQEEAEREQRRREKEEAELKKKLSVQKQASVMERFLKKCKTSPPQIEEMTKPTIYSPSTEKNENAPETITLNMDRALSSKEEANTDDLRKLHLSSWRHLGYSLRSNQKQCWGMRMKPKRELFKELKLTANKGLSHDDLSVKMLADGWEEHNSDDRSCHDDADVSAHDVKKCCVRKQLLQFDKSNRPAFYGIWPKKSNVVRPRCPWRKDPDLDYDVDSDEEWEEEEPGESLSDCDKDEEEEIGEGCSKADDEDESEDGFFVPDGYLSENEGVEVDRMESDVPVVVAQTSHISEQDGQNEEFGALLRQQKYLNSLTEHALRKNQPLFILNLLHEKASLLMAEDLNGTPKLEQTCLQALSMRAYPFGPSVEISIDSMEHDNQEACMSSGKAGATPALSVVPIPDSDLPLIVSTIQSCPHGIRKLLECLQEKFPSIPKSQLKDKVREISEFFDNRWQVKKEILVKLGMPISPEKGGGHTKSIAAFFSKRCLPPAADKSSTSSLPIETSPQQLLKPGSAAQGCTFNHA
ncbi:FASCIATA 1, NUCLEOSOME/CHROMATIN ASSEMBLY FACTOR GROUP B, FUGU 2 [Hibiscus trionum]|uniref:FASCIATA 1, NUCLEOSOME/CHROMATIN ASSEMBLY FACTOR GROUP B, FUGU 2 n=1 Tax=Hibiscus trionum TaxID=183268 RepID=A0A9W7HZ09_HIBTR|nr:FASCIATA 1, NUCLEOSOME/CHROMATIN ASSEMBLY FACTOR GROUP B, FUGU 2 [Hibiscus trionum]